MVSATLIADRSFTAARLMAKAVDVVGWEIAREHPEQAAQLALKWADAIIAEVKKEIST